MYIAKLLQESKRQSGNMLSAVLANVFSRLILLLLVVIAWIWMTHAFLFVYLFRVFF